MEGAVSLGERIRSTVEGTEFHYKDEIIEVRVSLGFAVIEDGSAADYEQMKHTAAAALAHAKSTGRNRSVLFPLPSNVAFEQAG
jgi:diguanylate cyclase (GGDEF)-like protein